MAYVAKKMTVVDYDLFVTCRWTEASPREEETLEVETEAGLRGEENLGSGTEEDMGLERDIHHTPDYSLNNEASVREENETVETELSLEDEEVAKQQSLQEEDDEDVLTEAELKRVPLQLAIAGRPNVGKSTLLNALLRQERVLTGPEPGLTRDSVRVEFEYEGQKVFLVNIFLLVPLYDLFPVLSFFYLCCNCLISHIPVLSYSS